MIKEVSTEGKIQIFTLSTLNFARKRHFTNQFWSWRYTRWQAVGDCLPMSIVKDYYFFSVNRPEAGWQCFSVFCDVRLSSKFIVWVSHPRSFTDRLMYSSDDLCLLFFRSICIPLLFFLVFIICLSLWPISLTLLVFGFTR